MVPVLRAGTFAPTRDGFAQVRAATALSLRLVARIEAWFQNLMALLIGRRDVSHICGFYPSKPLFQAFSSA